MRSCTTSQLVLSPALRDTPLPTRTANVPGAVCNVDASAARKSAPFRFEPWFIGPHPASSRARHLLERDPTNCKVRVHRKDVDHGFVQLGGAPGQLDANKRRWID